MNSRHLLICFFICISSEIIGSEIVNIPYTFITDDSLKVNSIPYSKYGALGITYVNDLKSNLPQDTIKRYFNPNTIISNRANWFIEIDRFSIRILEKEKIVKYYSKDELIKESFPSAIKFPNSEVKQITDDNWIIESFINDDVYYALLANGQLAKINLIQPKNTSPKNIGTISFEDYDSLKGTSDKIIFREFDYNFNPPEKIIVEKDSVNGIKEIINNKLQLNKNISFTVLFSSCKPKLLNYHESNESPIYLIGSKIDSTFNFEEFDYYFLIKEIIENVDNWDCNLNIENWVFSYRIIRD